MNIVDLSNCQHAIKKLAQWHHAEWGDYNPARTLAHRLDDMRLHLDDSLVPSTYVAIENNNVLGSASIVKHDMTIHHAYTPWLASVYVNAPERGQGVGSKLVKHVMRQAFYSGVTQLYLFTPDQVEFYRRLGWEVLMQEHYCGHDVTIMTARPELSDD